MNYRVYADGDLIYDTSVDTQELQLISPVLTKEVSCAGSFECTIPTTHFFYNNIKRFNTKIFVYRNDDTDPYWDGRVFDESTDIYNNRNVYCEGSLSYFNDTHQPQREYKAMTCRQVLEAIISIHNSKVDAIRQFGVGIAPVIFNPDEYFYTQYESSLDAINKLAEEFDCEIRVRWGVDQITGNPVRYIDFIKEFTDVSTQQIVFGENLLDFTRSYDMSNLVTVLLPLGKMEASDSTRNRNLGNEVSDDECDVVHTGKSWVEVPYELDGESVTIVEDVDTPATDYGSHYKAKFMYVQPGQIYYLTSRLQGGTDYLFYAICRDINGIPVVHTSKKVTSSSTAEDEKELKIEIPEGCCWLYFGGNDYDYPFVLYRDKELPDKFNDYFTAEKANNSSLYIKAVPREVTTYDEDGNPTTITVDPLEEWGYVEKSIEFEIPESVLDNHAQGEEAYSTLSEKREYRASAYLVRKANEYLTDYQFDSMQLEVNAVDLSYLGVNVGAIDIFMNIRAISPKHGLNRLFPVNKAVYHLDSPSSDTYSLGTKEDRNLTAVNNAIDSELFAKITEVPSTSSVLAAAQQNAAQIIESSTSGYVTFLREDPNNRERVTAITISNEPWENHPTTYWKWNSGGLGYTSNGGQSYLSAITMEGTIHGERIIAGTVYGDRIKGGQLTLGAYGDNTPDGSILVRDTVGNAVFSADKDSVMMRSSHQNQQDVWDRRLIFEDGELVGYNLDTNNQLRESCRFGPAMEGDGFFGGYIRSDSAIIINAGEWMHIDVNTLYISDSGDEHAQNETLTTTVNVGDKTLVFKHGMLINVETDEPEPEPEEE